MFLSEMFSEALGEPSAAIAYRVGQHLAGLFPGRAIVEGNDCDFDLLAFAKAGRCRARLDEDIHAQVSVGWSEDRGVYEMARNAWYEVEYEGHSLDVVILDPEQCFPYFWIVAEDRDVALRFFAAVCAFDPEVRDEVLVFDGGHWSESGRLFREIGGATFDNLILPDRLKRDLIADATRFFASKASYEKHGLPWKRGVLFVGSPGNGKTHAIKALVNALDLPCLYVKTFQSDRWSEATGIRRVFERARKASPCLLVFEDLDALVTDETRSLFLNELDGFASNVGILTIATTNHPGKLDPAILDRPSRFDRTYRFALPGPDERRAYLERWASTLEPEARPGPVAREATAAATDGFSFAYLKELCLSALMAWVADPDASPIDAVLAGQVVALREQMAASAAARGDSELK